MSARAASDSSGPGRVDPREEADKAEPTSLLPGGSRRTRHPSPHTLNPKLYAYVGEVVAACAHFLPYVTDGKNGGLGVVNLGPYGK